MFSEVTDGYILTAPRETITLIGNRVELDCATNSSGTADWHFKRYGSSKPEWISRGNQTRQNISDAFRIMNKEVGHFVLVIDPVLISLVGRYECIDNDEEKTFAAEVTALSKDIFRHIFRIICCCW